MAKALKETLVNFIKVLLTKWLEDIFVFTGVGVIVFTTYKSFGVTIGNYSLGLIFLLIGFLIAKK